MGLSRSAKISILLVIDVCFFLIELIAGYAVGSLALIADSFHMLNDVMSLVVALYAIKLTNNTSDSRYSYGWHRAEILAALVNGVFLLALCFSISLEAIERFFETPNISNPKLVVIVGSLGLASNLVGLFLFHEHGHSHSHSHTPSHPSSSRASSIRNETSSASVSGNTTPTQKQPSNAMPIRKRSPTRGRSPVRSAGHAHSHVAHSESFSSLYGHPAATRASLVQTAQEMASARSPSPPARRRDSIAHARASIDSVTASSPLTSLTSPVLASPQDLHRPSTPHINQSEDTPLLHHDDSEDVAMGRIHGGSGHGHGGHHHEHGSMNMRALVLHVLGDALGNVGVIATGLIIWLTTWPYKYYCDPVISLVITVIIFSSALPLVRSAAFILLQGVPATISLEDVKDSILNVSGVLSLHELHVWQLSENKIIASVHVLASRNHDFMPIAVKIREVLHYHGIHSCTIQPEYYPSSVISDDHLKTAADSPCLVLCPADEVCNPSEHACCPPPVVDV